MLVRHTRPDVAPGVCYGRTDLDVAASFSAEAAPILASLPPAERIVTSPLRRCLHLASHFATQRKLPLTVDRRIQEMDFGRWEGRRWNDIPRREIRAWTLDFLHARPHGGETVAELRARTLEALAHYHGCGSRTVIVTHAGVIKAALANGDTRESFQTWVDFGELVTMPNRAP